MTSINSIARALCAACAAAMTIGGVAYADKSAELLSACNAHPSHQKEQGRRICKCLAAETAGNDSLQAELLKALDDSSEATKASRDQMQFCVDNANKYA